MSRCKTSQPVIHSPLAGYKVPSSPILENQKIDCIRKYEPKNPDKGNANYHRVTQPIVMVSQVACDEVLHCDLSTKTGGVQGCIDVTQLR